MAVSAEVRNVEDEIDERVRSVKTDAAKRARRR